MKAVIGGKTRPQGTYISGRPGMGKSSLIQQMALQDIRKNRGVCVIDPTSDLVSRLVHWIPKSRVDDTIYFDTDDPIPIDFFSYRNPPERQMLADQLLNIFNLDNAPVARPRLQRIIGTLFDANEKGAECTFLDILRFIEDDSFRNKILDFTPDRKKQWTPFPKPGDLTSIVERMTPFYESPTLQKMMSTAKGGLKIWDVMQQRKVLLVNLKDTPTDLFIGALIVSKIQQATFGRYTIPEAQRVPFYLYIDECHTVMKFCAPEFEQILTRARKYKLCLTLANQIPEDLPKEIRQKLPTIATHISFDGPFTALASYHNIGLEQRIQTPTYLGGSPASYANLIQNRSVHSAPCNYPQVRQDEKDDEISPSAAPRNKTL